MEKLFKIDPIKLPLNESPVKNTALNRQGWRDTSFQFLNVETAQNLTTQSYEGVLIHHDGIPQFIGHERIINIVSNYQEHTKTISYYNDRGKIANCMHHEDHVEYIPKISAIPESS